MKCAVNDCEKNVDLRGVCRHHYNRRFKESIPLLPALSHAEAGAIGGKKGRGGGFAKLDPVTLREVSIRGALANLKKRQA